MRKDGGGEVREWRETLTHSRRKNPKPKWVSGIGPRDITWIKSEFGDVSSIR